MSLADRLVFLVGRECRCLTRACLGKGPCVLQPMPGLYVHPVTWGGGLPPSVTLTATSGSEQVLVCVRHPSYISYFSVEA